MISKVLIKILLEMQAFNDADYKSRLIECLHLHQNHNNKINPFPHDKIVDQTKLKVFADDKYNVTKMIISVFVRVEHTVGKGENAG